MSTIAAKWHIKEAEVRSLQNRVDDATKQFQRTPSDQSLSQLNAVRDQLKQRQEQK